MDAMVAISASHKELRGHMPKRDFDFIDRWFLDPRNLKSSFGKQDILRFELDLLSEKFPTDHVVWPSYCPLGGFVPHERKTTLRWRLYRTVSAFKEMRILRCSICLSVRGAYAAWNFRSFPLEYVGATKPLNAWWRCAT